MNAPARVLVVAADAVRQREIVVALESRSYRVDPFPSIAAGRDALRQQPPGLIVVDAADLPAADLVLFHRSAGEARIGVLALVSDPAQIDDACDDWLPWDSLAAELGPRVARLLRRSAEAVPLADPRFMALIVHDLRTPLNVFTLTIRALGQSVKTPTPDFEEDLTFLLENVRQIERMLAQLGDYSRLIETKGRSAAVEFQTRRFLTDFLEEKQAKRTPEFKGVRLEVTPDTPEVVELDPTRARLALHHALANAETSAAEASIRLRSGGSAQEWFLDIIVDQPSPATVTSTPLRSQLFERLVGSAAERRGFDLALAAQVSESFGGSAQLEIEPGTRSTVRLAWPVRPGTSP